MPLHLSGASPDAVTVRQIFERYLALRSVIALTVELDAVGILTAVRTGRSGKTLGGRPFTRGALYTMLQNRIYVGQVRHNETWYPGQHDGIVPEPVFEQVQALLAANRIDRLHGTNADDPSLLAGLVRDGLGRRMSPAHAVKGTRRYRYYVSRNEHDPSEPAWRLPAADLEAVVVSRIVTALGERDDELRIGAAEGSLRAGSASEQREALLASVDAITIHRDRIEVRLTDGYATPERATLTIPASIVRAGKQVRIATPPSVGDDAHPDPALIKLVVKAHMARRALEDHQGRTLDAVAEAAGYTRNYFAMLLRIGFLAPDITAAILDGRQPAGLTRQRLARVGELPLAWDAQRSLLGFAATI